MSEQNKALRAKVSLTDSLIIMGWMLDNVYFMSATDATKCIDKNHKSIGEWVYSEAAKVLPDKDLNAVTINNFEGRGRCITLYTTRCVFAYWLYWCSKGNTYAYALVSAIGVTDLDRLYDVAFTGKQKFENEYEEERSLITKLRLARLHCKMMHPGFQVACEKRHYQAWHVHNYMTLQIASMNADMARELKCIIVPNSDIGLDHYQYEHELALRRLTVAKRVFTGMRASNLTWQEQVDRAVKRAQKEIPA